MLQFCRGHGLASGHLTYIVIEFCDLQDTLDIHIGHTSQNTNPTHNHHKGNGISNIFSETRKWNLSSFDIISSNHLQTY